MAAAIVSSSPKSAVESTFSLLDPVALITPTRTLRTLTRPQVAFLISQGHVLTIHRGLIYRMNMWLGTHPGGDLPVLHFVGRDATDEIEAYHPVLALKQMKHYVVARVDGADFDEDDVEGGTGWKPLVPPVHLGWPGTAASYVGVSSVDDSLALMESFEKEGYPCSGSAPGTTLPHLKPADLEPAMVEGIDPVEQQRLAVSWRKFRHEILQEEGLFEMAPWELYKATIYRCSMLFASFLGFYVNATAKCEFLSLFLVRTSLS